MPINPILPAIMSRLLLLETASEVCSAAIAVDGQVVALVEDLRPPSHAALLTLQIEACVKMAGLPLASLDAVALSSGPGAYTSLRVGASVAKGICYALDKPLIAVDTLQALAGAMRAWYQRLESSTETVVYAPALDARRQEIWVALYDAQMQLLAPAQPLILENNLFFNFVSQGKHTDFSAHVVLGGNGAEKIRSGLNYEGSVFFTEIRCSAAHLLPLAERALQNTDFQPVAYFEPFYMKSPNITTPNNLSF